MKKKGVLSVWKTILLVFASFLGVGGATALTLFLTGEFNEKIVEPENMNISQTVEGEGFYNSELGRFEISGNSKLMISTTTEDVTQNKVRLSFKGVEHPETLSNGKITDGNIIIPQIVYINSQFDVEINEQYNSAMGFDWPIGGVSKIIAKAENDDKIENKTFTIAVDVPVSKIDLKIAGRDSVTEVQEVVVGSMFEIETVFSPLTSSYLYNDSTKTKNVYLTTVGSGISYDEETGKFYAVSETSEYSTVTAYVFRTAYDQVKFFEENKNFSEDQIIAYLRNHPEKSKSNSVNIKVVPVSVDEVDFALVGKTVTTSIDKNCKLVVGASTGDRNVGVSIKDSEGNSLPALYGNVGLKLTSEFECVTISANNADYDLNGDHKYMKVMVVKASGITTEKYNRNKTYVSDDEIEYYILPDTKPSNPGDYYWNISSTEIVEGEMGINFFHKNKNGVWEKYFEEDKTFVLSITGNSNETAIGWVYGHEGTISLSMVTDGEGNQSGKAFPLGNEVNEVEASNTYKIYRFFLYVEEGSALNIEDLFEVEAGVEYEKFLNGDDLSIDGIVGKYTLYELKNQSTYLQPKRSFDGKVKIVAAIVRTDSNGNVYPGNYQIVNISRSRDVTVEGILSISQFEGSTFEFVDDIEKADDGRYYIPSVSKDSFGQDKSLVKFVLNVTSNDSEKDAEKVLRAFENGLLDVVCLDENDNVNAQQFAYLKNLVRDRYSDGTEMNNQFVGEIVINSALVTEENGLSGIYVGLQLQYNNGVEISTLTLEQADLTKGFYVYRQIPEKIKTNFEEIGVNPRGVVSVEITEDDGKEIVWKANEGDGEIPLLEEDFEELLKVEILDQKGKKINDVDGLYKVSYVEVDAFDHAVTTDNIISVASNGKIGFKTTNGQELETYLKIRVEDASIDEGGEVQERIGLPSIKFVVKSEGISRVRYDESTEVGNKALVESSKLNEITIRKYVAEEDEIKLDELFDVTLSSGNISDNYEIKLDSTFVSSFSSRSKDLLMMIAFNDGSSSVDKDLSDYLSEEIRSVIVLNPFNQNTTIKFNIKEKNGLYDIVLNLTFLSDIDVSSTFKREMENLYSKYLADAPGNSNAISIFADEEYDLDYYLGFINNKYSWSKLAPLSADILSGLIDTNGISTVSLVSNGTSVSLKINQVYSLTNLTVKIFYGVRSAYAFSVTLSLYINPNLIAVQKEVSPFVDLSKIESANDYNGYKVSDFYDFYKLTDFVTLASASPLVNSFKAVFGTTSQYVSIDNSKGGKFIYANTSDVFNYDGKQLLQEIYALNANDDTRVDFVLQQGSNITVPTAENAVLYVSLGYYDDDERNMINNILHVERGGKDVTDSAIVTYNGKTTLLLMQEDVVKAQGDFKIKAVSSTECFNIGNGEGSAVVKAIIPFVYFEEEITLLLESSPAIRIKIPVIVTKVSNIFIKYTNEEYKDLAVLLGDIELQEEDIFEELEAGKTYKILTNDSVEGGENNIGLHYNKNSAYGFGNHNNPVVSIVEDAQGYKAGVATLISEGDSWSIKLADVATSNEDIYVVVKVTYSDISGTVVYNCYYRIKVVANIEKGETNYPYAENAEYLDSNSENVAKTYIYDKETNKYIVNLSQVFDGYTNANEKERFEISATMLAAEFESGKTYYALNEETKSLEEVNIFEADRYYYKNDTEILVATTFDSEETYYSDEEATNEIELVEFEENKYYITKVNPFESSYEISKLYIDGVETAVENTYINCSISGTTLELTVENESRKYDVVVEKKYYSADNNEIINASLYYTFKINQSSNYTYTITAGDTTLTATNGVFTYDIDAGSEAVTFVPRIYVDSNGTQTPVENFIIVYESNTNLATVEKNGNNEIVFTPEETISREGSIIFYAYTNEKMVFKFVVNVNSFYKFVYEKETVISGAKYNFEDLFALVNSKEINEANKDVTNNAEISLKDASQVGVAIDNDAHTIEFAYLTEDVRFVFEGTIEGYTFEFAILAKAKSPFVTETHNDSVIRYGGKDFAVGIEDLADCFDNENSNLANYLSIVEANEEGKITINPTNVANDDTTATKPIKVTYHWDGIEDKTTEITYKYIVNKNVVVTTNLPKPDGENQAKAEYVTTGTTLKFSEEAEFADAERIVVVDVEAAIAEDKTEVEKSYTIEVLKEETNNVNTDDIEKQFTSDNPFTLDSEITLTLTNAGSNGTVSFRVTVNNVAVTYNFVVIAAETVRIVTYATNYVEAVENIYVEDIAEFDNADLFAPNRILNMQFSENVGNGNTYYIRTRNEGIYKIYAVQAKPNEEVNIDLGKSCPDIEYIGTFTTLAQANDFTQAGVDNEVLYDVNPNVTSRIKFRYADGTIIKNLSSTVKNDVSDFKLDEMELNTPVTLDIYRSDKTTSVGKYKLKLSIEFDVKQTADDYNNPYTTKILKASNTDVSLLSMTEFGFTNTRTNTRFTRDMFLNSKANLSLEIYGNGKNSMNISDVTNANVYGFHTGLQSVGYATGLKPNAAKALNEAIVDNTKNYITVNGVPDPNSINKTVDWNILAQGADNKGNFVMMKLSYEVVVGEKTFSKTFNILFKVEDNSTILFNAYDEGMQDDDGDVGIVTANRTAPIVVESGKVLDLYKTIQAYMYGNTRDNQISTFTGFDYGSEILKDEHTYNVSDDCLASKITTPATITFETLPLGERYFFVDAHNDFGYKIRTYIKLVGECNPTMTMSSSTVTEGEEIGFTLAYTQVIASTLTPEAEGATYQTFTNDSCMFKPGETYVVVESSPAASDLVWIQAKSDGTGYNQNTIESGKILQKIVNSSNVTDFYVEKSDKSGYEKATTGSYNANTKYYNGDGPKYTEVKDFTNTSFMIGVPVGTNSDTLNEISIKVYRKIDTSDEKENKYQAGVDYYTLSGTTWTKETPTSGGSITGDVYREYIFHPTYTASSTVSPTAFDGNNKQIKTVVFTNINAYAFNNTYGYYDTAAVKSAELNSSSSIGNWEVKKIELIKDGITIGKTDDDTSCKLGTNNNVTFYNGTNSVKGVAATSGITIPKVNGYYFGTGSSISNVTMRVTLSDGAGNTATFTKTLQVTKGYTPGLAFFESASIVDGDGIKKKSETNLYNDTLEVTLEANSSVQFKLSATVGEEKKTSDTITVANNRLYTVTEYIPINANIKAGQNLISGNVEIDVTNGSAEFRYNGNVVSSQLTLAIYNDNIKLHINDIKELPTTLTENSSVSKTLYFVYEKDSYYYQTMQVFAVQPTSFVAKAGTNNRISAKAKQEENYYIIPFAEWAGNVYLNNGNEALSSKACHKYIFEINNSDEGGSGSAFVDENGNIITNENFIVSDQTVTVNVYVKASGNNGCFNKEQGILIGQFRISIGGTVSSASIIKYNENAQSYSAVETKYVYEVGSTVSIKDLLDGTNETTSTHYHVVKDNNTEYIRNNLDNWTFEIAGTHELYIVKTKNGSNPEYKKVTFIIYNTTSSSEKIEFVNDGGTYTYSETGIYKIEDNKAVLASTEVLSGKTGKVNVKLVETTGHTICNYSFYVLKDTQTAKIGKTQHDTFNLSNLDKNATEFYRVTRDGEDITSITQLKSETTVSNAINSQVEKEYLALNKDGTYTQWNVTYYIIPITETQKYQLVDENKTFNDAINTTGTIYKYGKNGILTELDDEKASDNLVQLKTVIVNGSIIERNTYNFSVYKEVLEVEVEVEQYSSNQSLSNLLDKVVVAKIDGVSSASITYYNYDLREGTRTQIVSKSFENIPEKGIEESYYTKVNNDYYLLKVTFVQRPIENE